MQLHRFGKAGNDAAQMGCTGFGDEFVDLLDDSGVKAVKISARAPNYSPFAERFVRSIKEECLGGLVFFGERSLRRAS